MHEDRRSWAVRGTALLPELLQLMDIAPAEEALLAALQPAAADLAPELIAAFYQRLFDHEHTAEYLRGVPTERLHAMVGDWFVQLFSGQYDEAYVSRRLHIGQIHVQIGLPVRYPLAMLDIVMDYGERVAQRSAVPAEAARALRKMLALDIAIFNQAYENHQLQHLAELVGNERLARRLLTIEQS